MTRYVGEGTGQRAAAAARWGVEDLRKRPAPDAAGAGDTPAVWLSAWAFDVDATVPTNTWASICGYPSGTPDGFFTELIAWNNAGTFSVDMNTGLVTLNDSAVYEFHAYVNFNEDAQVSNELRAVAMWRSGSSGSFTRFMYTHRFDTADTPMPMQNLPVSTFESSFGSRVVGVQVFHTAGVDLTIANAGILVRRLHLIADGEYTEHDPFA